MTVMIGVDPHKGSHTAVAVDHSERSLAELRVPSGAKQLERLLKWAQQFPERSWAVENATGLRFINLDCDPPVVFRHAASLISRDGLAREVRAGRRAVRRRGGPRA